MIVTLELGIKIRQTVFNQLSPINLAVFSQFKFIFCNASLAI